MNPEKTWEEFQASGVDPFTADDEVIAEMELAYADLRRRNLEGVGNGRFEGIEVAGSTEIE